MTPTLDAETLICQASKRETADAADCAAYNLWVRDSKPVTVMCWSSRVFGVTVGCEILHASRRSFLGRLYYQGTTWVATLPWGRIESVVTE